MTVERDPDTGAVGERPDIMQIHDGGCQCWPHVSQQDAVRAIEQVALMEYRDGLRRSGGAVGEREELDVERLRQSFRVLDTLRISLGEAERIAAEYARLSVNEGSAPVARTEAEPHEP